MILISKYTVHETGMQKKTMILISKVHKTGIYSKTISKSKKITKTENNRKTSVAKKNVSAILLENQLVEY